MSNEVVVGDLRLAAPGRCHVLHLERNCALASALVRVEQGPRLLPMFEDVNFDSHVFPWKLHPSQISRRHEVSEAADQYEIAV